MAKNERTVTKFRKGIKNLPRRNKRGSKEIGLHIITAYSDKQPCNQLLKQFREGIPETSDRLFKDLSKKYPSLKPDLMICWKIPERIVMDYEQTFPGLWAVAKIYPAIKHHGSIA